MKLIFNKNQLIALDCCYIINFNANINSKYLQVEKRDPSTTRPLFEDPRVRDEAGAFGAAECEDQGEKYHARRLVPEFAKSTGWATGNRPK